MKTTILFFFFSLIAFAMNAQEIISQEQTVIQRDTLFFLEETVVKDNGTSFPDTLVNTYLIGDSTTTANKLFDVAVQPFIRVAEGMKAALARDRATQVFTQVNPLFVALSGKGLIQEAGARFGEALKGRYRVFRQDGTNFTANITQLANGSLRLIGEAAEGTFVVNSLGPDAFQLVNFDHDQVGGGETFTFYWDGVNPERKMFWPAERVSGRTTVFRIVKIQ